MTETLHEDLCLAPLGAEVCTCDAIRQRRGSENPWSDVMVTVQMEQDEHEREHGHTLAAARVEVESLGHSRDCASWIWADRGLPCDCGKDEGTIAGEVVHDHPRRDTH